MNWTESEKKKPNKARCLDASCKFENEKFSLYDPKNEGKKYVCKNCFKIMSKQKKMPPLSIKNNLDVEALPPHLTGVTNMEN